MKLNEPVLAGVRLPGAGEDLAFQTLSALLFSGFADITPF